VYILSSINQGIDAVGDILHALIREFPDLRDKILASQRQDVAFNALLSRYQGALIEEAEIDAAEFPVSDEARTEIARRKVRLRYEILSYLNKVEASI
jgi:uncharacterized protein YdcH (DUF465 family)